MTERTGDDQLASDLARALVARAAPHELAIYRAASRAYFDNPNRSLRRRSAEDMLGFGSDSVAALTPYALAIADTVIAHLTDEGSAVSGHLDVDRVGRARTLAFDHARQLGLGVDKAQLLADATAAILEERTV